MMAGRGRPAMCALKSVPMLRACLLLNERECKLLFLVDCVLKSRAIMGTSDCGGQPERTQARSIEHLGEPSNMNWPRGFRGVTVST